MQHIEYSRKIKAAAELGKRTLDLENAFPHETLFQIVKPLYQPACLTPWQRLIADRLKLEGYRVFITEKTVRVGSGWTDDDPVQEEKRYFMVTSTYKALKTLNLHNAANKNEVKAAYRRLAMQYHPDRGEGSDVSKFKDIKAAFEYLEASYDRLSSANRSAKRSTLHGWQDVWEEAGSTAQADNWVINHYLNIPLKTAFLGGVVKVDGKDVLIPEKTFPREFFTIDDKRYGTDILTDKINVQWDGSNSGDVRSTINVSVLRLMMGGWVWYENFEGTVMRVYVAAGTKVDSTLKVANKGFFANKNTKRRGHLYLKIVAKVESVDKIDPSEVTEFLHLIGRD